MSQDLLAPPRITLRKYAIFVACISTLAIGIGAWFAARGVISVGTLAWRIGAITAVGLALVWGYSRLLRFSRRLPQERMPLVHAGVSAMSMIAFYTALGVMARGTFLGNAVPGILWMLPFMLGVMLITGGVARRVGESLHCPRCEYEFAYPNPDDAPIRCPECGSGWLGLLKKGRHVRSVRMMVAGVIVATLGATLGNPIFYMGALAPHLPTPLLCASVYLSLDGGQRDWEALATRTLSEKRIRSIAEQAIERRARRIFDHGPNRWFEAMVAAGTMPKDLQDRWYRAGFRAQLHVPAKARVGQEFTAHLRVRHATGGVGSCLGLIFAGYDLGEGTPRVGRADKTSWAHELDPGMLNGSRDLFPQTLKADHPGPMRVRATYWLVYLPSFTDPIAWQPDGAPFPPASVQWFERIDAEETIIVE